MMSKKAKFILTTISIFLLLILLQIQVYKNPAAQATGFPLNECKI